MLWDEEERKEREDGGQYLLAPTASEPLGPSASTPTHTYHIIARGPQPHAESALRDFS